MANVKISGLPVAASAAGTDLFAIVQGGVTKQLTNTLLFTSPTLVTPALGTPASGNLANCLGYSGANLSGTVAVANGGTGATTAPAALTNLGGTATGTALFTAANAAAGRATLSAAASGANSDITSLSGLTTALSVAQGGTGLTAAGTAGYVVTSDGAGFIMAPGGGGGGGSAAYTRTNFVATGGQTTFTVSYTVPLILVWVNGVLQSPSDYTATSGTDVVLTSACVVGDLVEFVAFTTVTIATAMLTDFSNATAANPASFGGTGLTSAGSAGNFLTSTGSTWQSSTVATVRGAVGIGVSSRKTANYTAVAGDYLACDTIAVGAFTVTLPAAPVAGDKPIVIFDAGTTSSVNGFATNNLTVARNGSTIHTLAEDAIISTKGVCVTFEYINGTWRARIG